MNLFAERLKQLRKEQNISQETLSHEIFVSQESISAYELGKHFPTLDILIKLSDYFGVSMDYLMGKDEHRFRSNDSSFDSFEEAIVANCRRLDAAHKMLLMKMSFEMVDLLKRFGDWVLL